MNHIGITASIATVAVVITNCRNKDDFVVNSAEEDFVLKFAEKNVGWTLLNAVTILGTNEGNVDGVEDGIYDKASKDANAPSSSVTPTEPAVGKLVLIGAGTAVGRSVVGATVAGARVAGAYVVGAIDTGAAVTGAAVTGALVTGGLVTGGLVTGGLVIGAGVDGITTGGDVDGGCVVPLLPSGLLPKPETRNVIVPVPDDVMSVIVIPVMTIFPF